MTVLDNEPERHLAQREFDQVSLLPPRLKFWRLYFVEMRPYLMFLSAVTGVAGLLVPFFISHHRVKRGGGLQ